MKKERPKNPDFTEVMSWIKNQKTPSVESLNKYLISKSLWRNQAGSLAKSYRYIIDMVNNVNKSKTDK